MKSQRKNIINEKKKKSFFLLTVLADKKLAIDVVEIHFSYLSEIEISKIEYTENFQNKIKIKINPNSQMRFQLKKNDVISFVLIICIHYQVKRVHNQLIVE